MTEIDILYICMHMQYPSARVSPTSSPRLHIGSTEFAAQVGQNKTLLTQYYDTLITRRRQK